MTSTLPPLIQAFSGSIGSATANTIVYPLDLVATRLQTSSSKKLRGFAGILRALQHVLQREGWSGLYDGLGTDTAANIISNFLYFYFYAFLRRLLVVRKTKAMRTSAKGPAKLAILSAVEELGIGFIAGVASRAVSTPLSVITVRLQTETEDEDEEDTQNSKPKGIVSMIKDIHEDQGLAGFWGGFSTTIPLSLNPAITMFLFQLYRRILMRKQSTAAVPATPGPVAAFIGAAFSNAVATWLLYPLMLAKTRLQVHRRRVKEGNASPKSHVSMLTIWEDALRREGGRGLYQGLEAQLLKGFVSQGVTMMVKQRVELLIIALYAGRRR